MLYTARPPPTPTRAYNVLTGPSERPVSLSAKRWLYDHESFDEIQTDLDLSPTWDPQHGEV